jgi:hypothetical protein
MPEKIEVELFLAIDEDGNVEIATEADEACENLGVNWRNRRCRVIKIKAKVAPPVIEEVALDIPDEFGVTTHID